MYYEELLNTESLLVTSNTIKKYHESLKDKVKHALYIASKARTRGFDPKKEVEIYIAQNVASRTEGLVGPSGIAKRFKELEEANLGKDQIVVKIAQEIASGKFSDGTAEERADQALRTAISYQTEGITAAPIEGISKVRIRSNPDNTQYLAVYYAGPIRSAGGTAQGISVYVADIIRKELGLARYKATEKETERMLEEVRLYKKIMNLQYSNSDEEIRIGWKNLPIMIQGDPTEREEVSGYRNIESIGTNRVRGGACLVLNDGLVGRAKKITKRVKQLQLDGWEWLEEIAAGKYSDKRAEESTAGENPNEVHPDLSFASDALMGRPTFSDATSHGGWRLRYGRSRNTGIAGIGIHPATMAIVNDFLAPGTHIRTERPGKGSIVTPVDSIRPPIVCLRSGDVVEIISYEHGQHLKDEIEEILFLGDMLVSFGEFIQNNSRLVPVGYNEEWWIQEMQKAGWKDEEDLTLDFIEKVLTQPPSAKEAVKLAEQYNIALHPKYTPAWKYLNHDEIKLLYDYLWKDDILPFEIKPILEKAFITHRVVQKGIQIENWKIPLKRQLPEDAIFDSNHGDGLKIVQSVSKVQIRDSMGTTVGARMGRPEKAKSRLMSPKLHGLFPVSENKQVKKILANAIEIETLDVEMANRHCENCRLQQWQNYCRNCQNETKLIGKCTNRKCGATMDEAPCDYCGSPFVKFTTKYSVNFFELANFARGKIGDLGEKKVKLKGKLKNPTGTVEILEKGILRARTNLNVFRDGTIRFDATDAPITHFYPREIGVGTDKLREMGYLHDIHGQPLEHRDQLLEIKPQDIIIHESAIKHFRNVADFIDRELEMIYNLDPYYQINNKDDLIGKLVIGLAPHTSAGVIGRIIGFTRSSVCWAHPFWHASKRRNCDGDEDGLILLMDGFLNFSKEYLPTTRGSKMDTPLVLVVTLNPQEVDDEAFNLDCVVNYPLELYEAADRLDKPFEVARKISSAKNRLGKEAQFEGFLYSHPTKDMSGGPLYTRYKDGSLNIRDKLQEQLTIAETIRAVDERETALRILEKHALPDLLGNLRAFASQQVRCVSCKTKYRRIPLRGKCTNKSCRNSNMILTVFPKSVSKYFDICQELVSRYNLGIYHEDRLAKVKLALDTHFTNIDDEELQLDLSDWF